VRGNVGRLRYGVAAFYNRYRDFIDTSAALNCPGDPSCVPGFFTTFQSVNRAKVRIRGLEGKAQYAFSDQWSAITAVGYSRGDDLGAHQPINTIDPLKGVLGLSWDAPAQKVGGTFMVTVVDAQDRLNESGGPLFHAPGYTVVDLTAYWNITGHARLSFGGFNLLDKTYWLSSDVMRTALRATDGAVDRFTQPPRYFSASFKYTL
jgi:hemoglobin/transferrin/lactoferrin receptor protein